MSQISIPNYPSNNLVPGVYFNVDASRANTGDFPKRALLIGQMTTTAVPSATAVMSLGTYPANVPVLAGSVSDVRKKAGNGSLLALMYAAFRRLDQFTEVWLLPLLDDPAAQPSGTTWTATGTATEPSVLSLYAAGQYVPVAINAGDTGAQVLANLGAALNANPDLPFAFNGLTTVSGTPTMGIQAKNKGLAANDIDVRINYAGAQNGETTPLGLVFNFMPFTGGAQNPTALPSALAALSDQPYDYVCLPYNDANSLNAVQSFLSDQAGRWSLLKEIYGHAFYAYRGTVSQRATFFNARNDQHASAIGFYDSPSPVWEWAAAFTAAASTSLNEDPALPVTGFVLPVLAPPQASQDTFDERNTMLTDGCSTFTVNISNQVVLERVVTTYTANPASGIPDDSYRDVETLFTLMACIRDMRTFLQGQFTRKKLVADGSLISGGSNMTTAQLIKQAAISRYRTQANVYGWCQNPDQFAKQIQSQNAGGGVVRLLLPYQLANQLRVIACNVQFTKP